MTKQEAIDAMLNGAKVTHKYFLPEEFIMMESGIIYDENNYPLLEFWKYRTTVDWNDNWSIWRMSESDAMWIESF